MRVEAFHSSAASHTLETHDPTKPSGKRLAHIALAVVLTFLWLTWLGWQIVGVYVGVPEVKVPVVVGKLLRKIGVTVSLGPRMVTVPDIALRNVADARMILERSQLQTAIVNEDYQEAVTSGTIIRKDPPAGSVVTKERGLAISFIQTRAVKGTEPGLVVAQRPAGGTTIGRRVAPITLVISRPPLAGEFNRPRSRTESNAPQ